MSDKSDDKKQTPPRPRKKRQIYAKGHKRKFLVVVDETPECESALAFAASRAQRTKGQLALLYVILLVLAVRGLMGWRRAVVAS